MTSNANPEECSVDLYSLGEWTEWLKNHKYITDPEFIDSMVRQISKAGIREPFTKKSFAPEEVQIIGKNYRETIRAGKLNSRLRGVFETIEEIGKEKPDVPSFRAKIYAPEAITDFALYMRGMFPKYIGSEYGSTLDEQITLFPIPHQNLQALTWPPKSFDLIVSNDVFEHVADLDVTLSECARVLNDSGILIATFPFANRSSTSLQRATIVNGKIQHYSEPEYHGNPMDPQGGSLVFQIPGWDILDRAKQVGFKSAHIRFISSCQYGILGAQHAGIFIFVAKK